MSKPTGLVRDSSLWIEYGPRDCGSCREAQNATGIYVRSSDGASGPGSNFLHRSIDLGRSAPVELCGEPLDPRGKFADGRNERLFVALLDLKRSVAVGPE